MDLIMALGMITATQDIIMRMIGEKIHAVAAQVMEAMETMEAMEEEVVETETEMEAEAMVVVTTAEVKAHQICVPDMKAITEEATTEDVPI
jgi:hypothetical protein